MANPAWPSALPQNPYANNGNPSFKPHDNVLATSMDAGPVKRRRRTTRAPVDLTFALRLTRAQRDVLATFYYETLSETLAFDWIDFRSGQPAVYRFAAPPSETYVAGDGALWDVAVALEMQP